MSTPPFPDGPHDPAYLPPPPQPQWGQPPGYGYPNPYPYPQPNPYPYAYPPPGFDPQAPYGRDPATGEPLSDKSAVVAGLLQLFFGCFGVGRFYLGSTSIAVGQLCLGLFTFVFGACLFWLPFLGSVVWAIVDAIMIFSGSVRDQYGRKLRS